MKLMKMLLVLLIAAGTTQVQAQQVEQYASSVLDFSSEWSSTSWSAAQALGAPNTESYGDISTSWAPRSSNGTQEFLTLGFNTPVSSTGAVIRETWGNGFVYQIDALDSSNNLHTVWSGTDNSLPGSPVDFSPTWVETPFQTVGLKIYVDTDHNLRTWEEIDSVKLISVSAIPEPETFTMMLVGLGLIGFLGNRKQQKPA